MLHVAAYVHQFDPFAIRFSGDFGIRWYGLAYLAGFVVAYLLMRFLAARRLILLSPWQVADLMLAAIVGTLLGGRLGYVLFYDPHLFVDFTSDFPFWGVVAINRGGMASHGGMIGVILGTLWFCRRTDINPLHGLDLVALMTPPGMLFGRLANFVNGELLGVPAKEGFPLAVKFPQEITDGPGSWWIEEMAPLSPLASHLGLSEREYTQTIQLAAEQQTEAIQALIAIRDRLVEQVQAGTPEVLRMVEPLLTARHPSQLYQAVAEGLVLGATLLILFAIFRPRGVRALDAPAASAARDEHKHEHDPLLRARTWSGPGRPGFVGAAFLITYGLLRVITEVWRLPDEGVDRVFGLSRGQLLSALMVVAGIVALMVVAAIQRRRRPSPGWSREDKAGGAGDQAR